MKVSTRESGGTRVVSIGKEMVVLWPDLVITMVEKKTPKKAYSITTVSADVVRMEDNCTKRK